MLKEAAIGCTELSQCHKLKNSMNEGDGDAQTSESFLSVYLSERWCCSQGEKDETEGRELYGKENQKLAWDF